MAQNLQKLNSWRPPQSRLVWLLSVLLAAGTIVPFLMSIIISFINSSGPNSITSISIFSEVSNAAKNSLLQAIISALIVLTLAPLFALGSLFLSLRQFYFSKIIRIALFCLPSLVVATSLILTWGNNGVGTLFLNRLGITSFTSSLLYSPYAVIFANVFMNLPFSSIVLSNALSNIPTEQIASATLLGLPRKVLLKTLFWPNIRNALFYCTGMTMLLSLNSFGALSVLGGTPESQTLELGIFQKVFYEGDWIGASYFAVAHTLIAGAIALLLLFPKIQSIGTHSIGLHQEDKNFSQLARLLYFPKFTSKAIAICVFATDLLFIFPVTWLFKNGMDTLFKNHFVLSSTNQVIADSLFTSFKFAVPAAFIATLAAWLIGKSYCDLGYIQARKTAANLLLLTLSMSIIPSASSAFGMFALQSKTEFINSTFSIIILHAAMMLPFLLNLCIAQYGRFIIPFLNSKFLLDIPKSKWLYKVELPVAAKILPLVFALGLCLSLSETAIVSMLSSPTEPALTTVMIRLMGSYQFQESALGSCFLIMTTFIVVAIFTFNRKISNEPY